MIFNPATIKEAVTEESLKADSTSHIFVRAFDLFFKQIDAELAKLM